MKCLVRISVVIGLALLALFLWPSDAGSQAPPLIATWHDGRTLVITWQVTEPVCVWIGGGPREPQPLAVPCGKIGTTELGTGGDSQYVPQQREWIELRNANSQVVTRLAVPERRWRVILPVVAVAP